MPFGRQWLDTTRDWLSRIDKDAKEARDKRIFDLWLECYEQEIANAVGITKQAVEQVCQETAGLPKLDKVDQSAAEHATDFTPPIYNVWKHQEKTNGSSHFGNSEVCWVDNLLYLYTKPFDMVVDSFAGANS